MRPGRTEGAALSWRGYALEAALDDPELVSLMQLRWRRTDLALRFAGGVERWIDRAREALE